MTDHVSARLQVYTMWQNLKKTNSMEVGQVGFNHPDRVRFAARCIGVLELIMPIF